MTNRTQRLKAALFQNNREISLERAQLYTASYQQTEGELVILRRAKATAYILEHVEISIRDGGADCREPYGETSGRDYSPENGPVLVT